MNYNYSTAPNDVGVLSNGTVTYGQGYIVLPNGTYIFTNNLNLTFHSKTWLGTIGDICYIIPFTSIRTIYDNGTIALTNGTDINTYPDTYEFMSYVLITQHDGLLTHLSYSTYLLSGGKITSGGIIGGSETLPITSLQGALLIITVIMMVSSVVGIKVFGSGLDSFTVETITKGTFYFGFFGILSTLAYPMIADLYMLGSFFYFILTVMYIYGFVQNLHSDSGS